MREFRIPAIGLNAPLSRRLLLGASAATLAGCSSGGMNFGGTSTADLPAGSPASGGPSIGNGPVKVGLLVPLSSGGNASTVANNLRNAVELAVSEFKNPDLTILVRDDGGTPQGAAAAATAVLAEGAELILGPLFAPSVQAAGQVARGKGKPLIAFSTDAAVAAPGVYLLSFLPQGDIARIVQYAAQSGKRSFAALLPANAYGQLAQASFQEAVAANGGRVIAIESFSMDQASVNAAALKLGGIAGQIDAVFVPDPFDGAAINALKAARIDPARVQVLGAGPWDGNGNAARLAPTAVYAAADTAGFRNFAQRYQAKFGHAPARIASLGYDAASLVAALSVSYGAQRFAPATLTNASGFNGVDGLFRFKGDGTNQRGLAVLKAGGTIVSPAPRTFTGS